MSEPQSPTEPAEPAEPRERPVVTHSNVYVKNIPDDVDDDMLTLIFAVSPYECTETPRLNRTNTGTNSSTSARKRRSAHAFQIAGQ